MSNKDQNRVIELERQLAELIDVSYELTLAADTVMASQAPGERPSCFDNLAKRQAKTKVVLHKHGF